jgi:hypothetical protein
MKKIYAVGVVKMKDRYDTLLIRLFNSLDNAKKSILSNEGDLFEYYYDYAFIEEAFIMDEGHDKFGIQKTWWYEMNWETKVVQSCEKPERFQNAICLLTSIF